jgi:hypothetical protein
MTQIKPVFASRTVICGLLSVGASFILIMGGPQAMAALLGDAGFQSAVANVVLQTVSASGAAGAVWFRIRATARLE